MSENKVYFVYDKEKNVGYNIAAKNNALAKQIFVTNNLLDCKNIDMDIGVKLQKDYYPNGEWDEEGVVFTTNYEGVLNVRQENEIGIVWFNCLECGDDSFDFNDNLSKYICKNCGYEDDVPYKE